MHLFSPKHLCHLYFRRNTTNEFDQHSLIGSVATISAIVIAVGKPIAAKFADVLGRTEVSVLL